MKTLINKYMAWACMAAVAAVMITGGPSLAREAAYAADLSVLNELIGVEDLSAVAATKYCGSQASGCDHWTDDGKPGKSGSPTGICTSKSACSDKGTGKGGKECTCCGRYKDENGETKDCPTAETAVHDAVLSVF